MANWETQATASTFNAAEHIQKQMDGRQRTDDYFGGGVIESMQEASAYEDSVSNNFDFWSFVTGKKEYSVVGIDGSKVPAMKAAIENYVAAVQAYLEKAITATEEQISGGLRGGEAEKAVKDYLDKVKAYIYNLVSTLNSFSDKLADVGNAWVDAQSQIASNVNASTGAFSEGSAYTANNVQYKGASR